MSNFIVGKIYWFVRIEVEKESTFLGFVRTSKAGGALVIGGLTGTHFTGHGEKWESKIQEVLSNGFKLVEEAQNNKLIPKDWTAPSLTEEEKGFLTHIHSGVI